MNAAKQALVAPAAMRGDVVGSPSSARTYTACGWAADLFEVIRLAPRLLVVYGGGRIEAGLRERIMVAVSRTNACAACARVHEAWASRAGVPEDVLEELRVGDLGAFSVEDRATIRYAIALAESRCDRVAADARTPADDVLSEGDRQDIEAVVRLMTFANVTVNTAHAVARRHRVDGRARGRVKRLRARSRGTEATASASPFASRSSRT